MMRQVMATAGLVPQNTQSVTYTSFESISTLSENNYVASFTYNPDAQRAKMVVQQSGNTILSRWYSGSSYAKETAGGVTKQYTYIGGDAYTAPVVAVKTGTGTPVYYYLLRDYLGSITHVVNTSKITVAEYSYDAWGRMRNPTNWTNYAPGTEPALFVAGRGFTGHACPPKLKRRWEHMPWFNSINMNGRVYDPLIGQFLSPDNYVQSPDFTQNFNRYSYCLNNPLIYTDPSGELGLLLSSLIYFAGQYAINWLSNVINEKMTPKEAFQNTPIIMGVQGTIPYKENKPPTNTYGGSSTGISETDLAKLGKTQSTSDGYYGVPLYEKAILGGGPGSKFFSTDLAAMDFGIRYNDNSLVEF